jgi:hypothetical protein
MRLCPMAGKIDIFDNEPWTEMDIAHLSVALGSGDTIEKPLGFSFDLAQWTMFGARLRSLG